MEKNVVVENLYNSLSRMYHYTKDMPELQKEEYNGIKLDTHRWLGIKQEDMTDADHQMGIMLAREYASILEKEHLISTKARIKAKLIEIRRTYL